MRVRHAIGSLITATAALIAGCGKAPAPDVVIVSPETPAPQIAAECDARRDAPWTELADADITRSAGARNYRANKSAYRGLLARRRICAASLAALFPAASGKE